MYPNNPPFGGPTAPPPYPDYANPNPGLPPAFPTSGGMSHPSLPPMGFSQPSVTSAYPGFRGHHQNPTQAQPYPPAPAYNNNYSSGMPTASGYPTPSIYAAAGTAGYPPQAQTYPPPAYPGSVPSPPYPGGAINPAYPNTTPYGSNVNAYPNPSQPYPGVGVANPSPYPATSLPYPNNPNNPSYPGSQPQQPGYGYR